MYTEGPTTNNERPLLDECLDHLIARQLADVDRYREARRIKDLAKQANATSDEKVLT